MQPAHKKHPDDGGDEDDDDDGGADDDFDADVRAKDPRPEEVHVETEESAAARLGLKLDKDWIYNFGRKPAGHLRSLPFGNSNTWVFFGRVVF